MAERMSAKTFEMWRKRLRHAKDTWVRKGLLGTEHPSSLRLLIEFYRGNQWVGMGDAFADLDEDFRTTVNKVFPIANTLQGEVSARNPRVSIFPRNPDHATKAGPVEALINYDIQELDMQRQGNKALAHHLFAPAGIIQHGFTPRDEWETESGRRLQLYRPAKPDRPFMRARPMWNVLMDPTGESFRPDEGMWWVAFRDVMWLEDIRDNPSMIERKDLGDFAGNISREWEREDDTDVIRTQDDPDRQKYVEVFTVYESRERTWFQMTLDGLDKPLRQPDEWPIPWETLPVTVLQVNEQMDTPFSLSLMDQVVPIQEGMNKLRTMMDQLVFRLRRIIGVQTGGMERNELTKLETAMLHEIIETKGDPAKTIQAISSGVFPQELLQYLAVYEEDAREVMGQSKMDRAQRINVESASEAAFVQQGSDVSTARIVSAFEKFNQESIQLYMQGRRATMEHTGAEIVRIVGQQDANGVQAWATVSPEDLHGDFELEVVHGSTRKRDRAEESRQAGVDMQMAITSPDMFNVAYFASKYIEARGLDPTRAMTENALTASKVRQVDAIRRNAAIEPEAPADGGMRPEAAAFSSNAGSGGLPQ